MTGQMFWVLFAMFGLGLFVGSNLGVMLMCALRLAGQSDARRYEVVAVPITTSS